MWTRPTGDGHQIVEDGPQVCPNGHALRYPNVLKGANARDAWFLCNTCDLVIHRMHKRPIQWVTQGMHGPRLALPGYVTKLPWDDLK